VFGTSAPLARRAVLELLALGLTVRDVAELLRGSSTGTRSLRLFAALSSRYW
jgi:hypothetical protein